MGNILYNVTFNTQRPQYTKTTQVTNAPSPWLTNVSGAISMNSTPKWQTLPNGAVNSEYSLMVDTGTDITPGDQIYNIRLNDGVTPWPGDVPLVGMAGSPPVIWWVNFILETAPGFLAVRMVYIGRTFYGGKINVPF